MTSVLIVDDEMGIRVTLQAFLKAQGYEVNVAEDVETALKLLDSRSYDVVVTDIVLPRLSGMSLLETIRAKAPDVPVIMMTGEPTVETAVAAVRAGARDYITKPVGKNAIVRAVGTAAQVKALEDEKRRLEGEKREYQRNLERLVEERTAALKKTLGELQQTIDGVISAMALTVESRDPYTAGHQQRVADLAHAIGVEMGLGEEQLKAIRYGGMIHDLGKVAVPAEILTKPGTLTEIEMRLLRTHPLVAHGILKGIRFPWPIADIIIQHHERLDGSGYPAGLQGAQILLEARIIATADVVEAMASGRPYRAALGLEVALSEIVAKRGAFYEPGAVDACVGLFRSGRFHFVER